MLWDRIKESMGIYNTTKSSKSIVDRIAKGKSVEVTNPTSYRTFKKAGDSYVSGEVKIGKTDDGKQVEVVSSVVKKVKYNPSDGIATLTFHTGKSYDYKVTPEEFQDFINADSKGSFVASHWNHNPHFHI